MKRIYGYLLIALAVMPGCAKDPSGTIGVTLSIAAVPTNVRSSIDQFIFLIGKSGSSEKLLYPSTCLGCTSHTSPCPTNDQCLKTDCGFSATDATFDPEIDFGDVKAGATLDIIACGLDNTSNPVTSGEDTVANTAGSSTTIHLTSSSTLCLNKFPPGGICPR
jgi:hypothetical protein